jgi:hypothetical protein
MNEMYAVLSFSLVYRYSFCAVLCFYGTRGFARDTYVKYVSTHAIKRALGSEQSVTSRPTYVRMIHPRGNRKSDEKIIIGLLFIY